MEKTALEELQLIIDKLTAPDGCPWDKEQTPESLTEYIIEESHELVSAIRSGNVADIREELGDVAFLLLFVARLYEKEGQFSFADALNNNKAKMIRRHPHVFGEDEQRSSAEQTRAWEVIKAQERAKKGRNASLLDDVPVGLPGLTRAVKLTARAARVGFDWPDAPRVLEKLREETAELETEILAGADKARLRDELGDILFVCANLARKLDLEPEDALRSTNAKFARRFQFIEAELAKRGKSADQSDLAEMDALWDAAKLVEKA